jgi:cysteine-rich repeat protein
LTPDPVCGDGIVNGNEPCDDGNQVNNDACTNACTLPVCGDSIVNGNEACDDGNQINDDACTNACALPGCGDGIVNGDEACDDGNQVNNDACSNVCTLPVCGDSIVNGSEECDDGNNIDNDGCHANCMLPICPGGDDTDTDSDTILDCNDNCLNTENAGQDDADEDGAGDACDVCPDDENKSTSAGDCGCGIAETDTDDDGINDCIDNAPYNPNPNQADADGDGIGDAAEMGPDGNDAQYDGNGDGIPDLLQQNVASISVNYGQDYVTLSTEAGNTLENMAYVSVDDVEDLPAEVDLPFGLFEFTIVTQVPGGVATLTLEVPANANQMGVNTYYKFGPTPTDNTLHWYDFLYDQATNTGAEFLNDQIILTFTDGARGDDDLVADAIIIDLGGPAVQGGGGGGNNGGSCFIDTVFSSFNKN